MKKLLLLLLITPFVSQSQIVNIPDANFKMALVQAGYDTDSDGNIQLSEAQAVTDLYINEIPGYPITSLEGMQAFSNTKQFNTSSITMSAIDLSPLTLLEGINLSSCANLTAVNTAGLTSMKSFFIMYCPQLASLPFTGLSAVEYINIMGGNNLVNVDVRPCTNLAWMRIESLTSLNASGLIHLTYIDCYGSDQLNFLDVTGCIALETLEAWHSHIENLDVHGLTSLKKIDIQTALPGFPATNLNASGCTALENIQSMMGNLGTVNVSGCTALKEIRADMNYITSLDISGCNALDKLYLTGNQLTTIDVSHCALLTTLDVSGNPMESIYIKNGTNEHLQFNNIPVAPQFICADEEDIPGFLFMLDPEQTICNPYCTFLPGGNYNSITGTVRLDLGGDGCSETDMGMPMLRVGYDNGTDEFASFTRYDGSYTLFAHTGTMTPTAQIENPTYWNISAAAPVTFADEASHNEVRDFCITPNGTHPDVEVSIIPMQPARPGFEANYYIVLKNKGNQTLSNSLTFSYNGSVMNSITVEPAADSQSAGNLTWNYTNLAPFGTQYFYVEFHVNSPLDTPAVNIDDILDFGASALVSNDETPTDNSFTLHQTVLGSFDPNDKHCLQGTIVPPTQIGNYLFYVINFENTGNFPAEKVAIKDLIDTTKFDISSFQMLGHSHNVQPTITGDKVEFFFDDINLAPNEYGYVGYKIKTLGNLPVGTTVTNTANIYFDFNAPVVTDTVATTFQSLGVGENTFDASVRVFPNPAHNSVQIKADIVISKVVVTDIQGRTIGQFSGSENQMTMNVSNYASGIYALKITTEKGIVSQKLIIE